MKSITSFTGEYAFLNNGYNCSIEYGGLICKSAEHAFQLAKVMEGLDISGRQDIFPSGKVVDGADKSQMNLLVSIADAPSVSEARRIARAQALAPKWDKIKVSKMREILEVKFNQLDLGIRLLMTEGYDLVQVMKNDNFWGADSSNNGQNHIGKILMDIRAELKVKFGKPYEMFTHSVQMELGNKYTWFLLKLKTAIAEAQAGNNKELNKLVVNMANSDMEADLISDEAFLSSGK